MSDVFTELGLAALNARHDGTATERAEAARLTLAGKLPPLPPHVALMTQTPFSEVAQVAISPVGKIAVLGIETNGAKEVVEWQVIDDRWTSRDIYSTDADSRIDHLHYPELNGDVAFTVTAPDGKMCVHWGDWKFNTSHESICKIAGIYCYSGDMGLRGEQRGCVVVFSRNGQEIAVLYRHEDPLELVGGDEVKILALFDHRIAISRTRANRQSMCLVDLVGNQHWDSHGYDRILEDSVMVRDGEVSFVGWNAGRQGREESGTFLVKSSDTTVYGVLDAPVFCLESGRILTFTHDGTGDRGLVLHDIGSDRELYDGDGNGRINLSDVRRILEIVEIPSGLAIQVIMQAGTHRLLIVHENYDVVPGVYQIQTDGDVSNLRRWGNTLVYHEGNQLRVVDITDLEQWLVTCDDRVYESAYIDSFPLYTPFDRLVPTEEGILGWHFVNGTFTIIRYAL